MSVRSPRSLNLSKEYKSSFYIIFSQLYVLEGLVGGAQSLPKEDDCMLRLLKKVRAFSTSTSDPALREVAVLLHAATLNKLPEGEG